MIPRTLAPVLKKLAEQYPAVTITGPRQSGKTTLCRLTFPDMPYISLESPDVRDFARTDPRGFLNSYPDGAILDEIQRVPDLVSYLQPIIDRSNQPGRYILTGSQQCEVMTTITQSLAGRTGVYDVTVRTGSGKTVALFRGKSYRIQGEVIAGLEQAATLSTN